LENVFQKLFEGKIEIPGAERNVGRREKICVMCVSVVSIELGRCEEKEGENFLFYPYI
jgi:hypothetical protein